MFQKLLRERRRTIAQAEARYATATARQEAATARGAKTKFWITVGDSRVGDDHQANEAQGGIPINSKFSSGDSTPPGRPNCRCTLAYATSDGQIGRMEVRQKARAESTARTKDRAEAVENAAKAERKRLKEGIE